MHREMPVGLSSLQCVLRFIGEREKSGIELALQDIVVSIILVLN